MTAPRFISRVADAVGPLIGLRGDALVARLDVTVGLRAGRDAEVPACGFEFAANLLARLYPRIVVDGPPGLRTLAAERIRAINPRCELLPADASAEVWLRWASEPDDEAVTVWASGANVALDAELGDFGDPEPSAALIAGALGVGEVFRQVFAPELGPRGRRTGTPFTFNVVTLASPCALPTPLTAIDLGRVALVGAGAIGQAATLTLAETRARGRIVVIDPESVELSNLQRYVLSSDQDVGGRKTKLAITKLRAAGMVTNGVDRQWDVSMADGTFDAVLVALDSERDRVGVAASLPGAIYNAWTQERDLGWSRHEQFGSKACLACLHWPTQPRPHQHETIAAELGQHPLRVLAYLVARLPAGVPLPADRIPVTPLIPAPPEVNEWTQRSILDDVATAAQADADQLAPWRERPLHEFHQEAICAGALLDLDLAADQPPALVPLAHQSAIAGIMLATQALVGREPELRELRPSAIEGRLNVLDRLPQVMPRPRDRTRGCICSDTDFLAASRQEVA